MARERDSILLMQAYAWVEETKKGTTFFNHHVLIKEWWSQSIQDSNIYKRWLSLWPEDNRTSSAVIARWKVEAIIHAENLAAREKHLDLMKRNTEASCSIAESFKIMAERRN